MHCLFVYLAYLYYLYGDDMAHELGNCYGKKTCAWRRENARKARRKLDWRPSERTDAGGAGENAYRCYRNAIPGV